MALPPVARVNCGELIVMDGLVFAVLVPSVMSLEVIVAVPTVFSETRNDWVPATRSSSAASTALLSEEVR